MLQPPPQEDAANREPGPDSGNQYEVPTLQPALLDRVVQRLEEVSRMLESRDMPIGRDQDAQWESHTRAMDGLDRDVAAAKTELERDFRDVLQGKV